MKWCANYDKEYGCLPLECECYMFGKCWTGAYCRYFREAVLPLDPALEAALLTEGPPPVFKPCPICGGAVPVDGRMAYCSEACARIALRRQKREYMRKSGGDVWKLGPGNPLITRLSGAGFGVGRMFLCPAPISAKCFPHPRAVTSGHFVQRWRLISTNSGGAVYGAKCRI